MTEKSSNSSTTTETDEPIIRPVKRYKLPLNPDFDKYEVSFRTFKRWNKSSEMQKPGSQVSNEESDMSSPSPQIDVEMSSTIEDFIQPASDQSFQNINEESKSTDKNVNSANESNNEDEIICSDYSDRIFEERNIIEDSDNGSERFNFEDESDNYESTESKSDAEECIINENDNFFLDQMMFEAANLTVRDIICMSTAVCLRYCIFDEARLQIVDMLKLCAGPQFKTLNFSKYMMLKCFKSQSENITRHYFCNQCHKKIVYSVKAINKVKKQSKMCDNCNNLNSISTTSSDYFLSLSLRYQLKQLFSNKIVFNDILENLRSRNDNRNGNIEDVYDSQIHRNIIRSNHFDTILTLNINTDGAPLTRSGKRGFWPLQIILNDLSPKLRSRFVLLAGILTVEKEPKSNLLNLYLCKFVEELNDLYTNGLNLTKDGETYLFKFCVLSCVVDSVCRPIIQNRLQFNGFCGCSWCYQRGEFLKAVNGIRYAFKVENIVRTHDSHIEDANQSKSGKIIRGVKGESIFAELPLFDMVWSFPYEYMHSMLLGVTYQLWKQWKNGSTAFKISKKDVERIEKQYLSITPTHDIHRLPRSGIIQGSTKPKASELKSWLLYYSLPCLSNILDQEALEHYALLVKSAFTLLNSKISDEELNECEQDLMKFVCLYEMHYEAENMTFNVHVLLHAVESVRKTGPLNVNSAFPFESHIYNLKTYINGPKAMDQQIAKKHLQILVYKTGNTNSLKLSQDAMAYCQKLFIPKRLSTYYDDSSKDVVYFGKRETVKILEQNIRTDYSVYPKCVYKSTVHHSCRYTRAHKTDDTIVLLVTGEYGRIQEIIKVNDNICRLYLVLFEIYPEDPFSGVSHIKKIKSEAQTATVMTSIENVKQKIVLVKTTTARYLCMLPNTVEVQ